VALNTNRIRQTRFIVSAIVIALCLLAVFVLFLRDIEPSNWREELLFQYFPLLALPATFIYLILLAFRVHKLEHAVVEASFYDSLTHTLKFMPLIKKATKAYKDTDLADSPVSVVCISIDRLEAIKEEYGEAAVNAVLREFGGTLIGATRENDLVGNYEKNIFIAVAMQTGKDYAESVAARFQELAHADVVLNDDEEIRYSISVGYSCSDQGDQPPDFDTLFEHAKNTLNTAQAQGPATILGWSP